MWKDDLEIIMNEGLLNYDGNEIYLTGKIIINANNINDLYKSFQINKKYRKDIEKIELDFVYNFNKNKFRFDNVRVDNAANEKLDRFIDSHNFDGSSLHNEHIINNNLNINNFEIVETINITDFCLENKINQIDILKIDAEGSEYDILHSLKNNISKITIIYCESHNSKNYSKINDLLKKSHKIFRDYKKKNDLFETVYVRKNYYK